MRGKRAQFDFNQRVQLAKVYLDDGAPRTAADRLERLAKDIRDHADAVDREMGLMPPSAAK